MSEIEELKATIEAQKKKYERKKAENARLRNTFNALLERGNTSSDDEATAFKEGNSRDVVDEDDELAGDSDVDEADALPVPIWNESEETFFCTECTWEVVDGECSRCGLQHAWEETAQMVQDRIDNGNYVIHPDRALVPRGTTPTRELMSDELSDPPPKGYTPELYWALLQRGATIDMCWNYRLKYTYQGGIWVEFDPSSRLYKELLHPSFHNGLKWRVYLGRQLQLADDDPDGTLLIEGIIDDAIFFPYLDSQSDSAYEVWETVMKSGFWLTRPNGSAIDEPDDSTSEKEDETSDEDSDGTEENIENLENRPSLLPRPFMNDYLPPSDNEDSEEEEEEDELMEGIQKIALDTQPADTTVTDEPSEVETQLSEDSDEEDELGDDEAALQLFPDTAYESDAENEEDSDGEWTESDYQASEGSDAEWSE